MPIHNHNIAGMLNELADRLEMDGANAFRIRSYRNAAHSIHEMSRDISGMVANKEDISQLPDVGKNMAEKIKVIVQTGQLDLLNELREKIPVDTKTLLQLTQLGPKRLKLLYDELGITTLKELQEAAQNDQIADLKGFGKKTQQKILEEIHKYLQQKDTVKRFKWAIAEQIITPFLEYIKSHKDVLQAEIAGSYRRRKETVGDIDILIICNNAKSVMEHFVSYEEVKEILSHGSTKSSVILVSGIQVDLRAISKESYGSALHYFTGSKEHNVAVRKIAVSKNLKINEYGIYKNDERLAGEDEAGIYQQIGLQYIEPELRENRGEIEAAQKNSLPKLVTINDIKGDLQSHTTASDGKYTLEEMAEAARKRGYEYFAITDHSKRVTMAHGLDDKRVLEQIEAINKVNETYSDITILKSMEVDILKDGSLDLSNEVLKQLDIVVFAIHYYRNLSRDDQTNRVLKAMQNPYVHIMAHPTGRLIGKRDSYEIDMEKIIHAAKDNGCFLEINAAPERLDLSDIYAKMAKDVGVKLAISTDAHSEDNLNYMRFGVAQARRAWLEPKDVLNTYSWTDLKQMIKRI